MQNRPSMSNMVSEEPAKRETLNFRESIIPKVEDTPVKTNVKPPPPPPTGPPPPPPPPPPKIKANDVRPSTNTGFSAEGLNPRDAINAELKYRASDAGKAELARKKAEKEARKAEGKSMLDSMGMSFPSPFTPAPKTQSTALIVRPEPQSMFDFVAGGGTPKQTPKKSEHDKQQEIKTSMLRELKGKPNKSTKEKLQLNDLKAELIGTPNVKSEIASLAIQKAVREHRARKQIANETNELEKQLKGVESTVGKAKKEHTLNVFDDLTYKKRIQKGKNKAMDKLTEQIGNTTAAITTRGQTDEREKKLLKLGILKDKIAKSTFKRVGPGRPRKSGAMTNLEKQLHPYQGKAQTEL
jgi:hypothetical protein